MIRGQPLSTIAARARLALGVALVATTPVFAVAELAVDDGQNLVEARDPAGRAAAVVSPLDVTERARAAVDGEAAPAPATSSPEDIERWRTLLAALHGRARVDGDTPETEASRVETADALVERAVAARRRLAQSLRMPGAPVVESCRARRGPFCAEQSLDRFFSALAALDARRAVPDAARTGAGARHVRVAALGNSLIASDHITDIVRERLVARFGDGGRGFVLVDRMAPYGRRTRTAKSAVGFTPFHIGLGERGAFPHGIGGVLHTATARATSRLTVSGETRARVFWLDHDEAPSLTVVVDGEAPIELAPTRTGAARIDDVALGATTRQLDLKAERGAVLYGVSLERAEPGVIVDTLGVPAVDAGLFLSVDEAVARGQLQALDPSLLLFVLGGNEIKRLAWGKKSLVETEEEMRALFARLRDDAPNASCLVVGPVENVVGDDAEDPFAARRQTLLVNDAYERVARAHGCAFFDTFAAMGGRGALRRLHERGLLHDDLVHPRGPALDVIGELIVSALLDAYDAHAPERREAALGAPLVAVGADVLVEPLPPALAALPVVDVFVARDEGARAFADALSEAIGARVNIHAPPVRPIGLLIDIERRDDDAARDVVRLRDGASGAVLARAPLAPVFVARAALGLDATLDDEARRRAALVDAARVLLAAAWRVPSTAGASLEGVEVRARLAGGPT